VKGETNRMPDYLIGLARDRTLSWATKFDPDGTRHLTIHLLLDGKRSGAQPHRCARSRKRAVTPACSICLSPPSPRFSW
jgi:hypothetical protein